MAPERLPLLRPYRLIDEVRAHLTLGKDVNVAAFVSYLLFVVQSALLKFGIDENPDAASAFVILTLTNLTLLIIANTRLIALDRQSDHELSQKMGRLVEILSTGNILLNPRCGRTTARLVYGSELKHVLFMSGTILAFINFGSFHATQRYADNPVFGSVAPIASGLLSLSAGILLSRYQSGIKDIIDAGKKQQQDIEKQQRTQQKQEIKEACAPLVTCIRQTGPLETLTTTQKVVLHTSIQKVTRALSMLSRNASPASEKTGPRPQI